MPITVGSVSGRIWRVLETLPPNFKEMFERNLARHAFKPIDPERGQLQAVGWVNIRQLLDSRLTLDKVLFRNLIALGLRVDRLAINQRVFRATLAQAIGKKLHETERKELSREEKLVIEDKVRLDLIKHTQPNTAVYEMIWQLESGTVLFSSGSQKLGLIFSDLFSETFQVSVEPQLPFLRAQHWADRNRMGQELLELLPSPFSPEAPVDVVEEVGAGEEE
ncbi:hypothetical protein LLG95_13610 [bacterium]|nr:hypothetical protein [bacterium]